MDGWVGWERGILEGDEVLGLMVIGNLEIFLSN